MKTLMCAFLLAGLVTNAAPAKHKKHARTTHRATASQENLGTKGFPPKPLPAANPLNPADPQQSRINKRAPAPDAPVKPPDATAPTRH
jgi:hypothetical protein